MNRLLEGRISGHLLEELFPRNLLESRVATELDCPLETGIGCRPLTCDELVLGDGKGDIPLFGLCFLQEQGDFKRLRNPGLGGVEVDHVTQEGYVVG